MHARNLIGSVQNEHSGTLQPPEDYLLEEYYALLVKLTLALPGSDANLTLLPEDGKLVCDLVPAQVRRVFCGEDELLRGSAELLALLPHAPLYCPMAGGIAVNTDAECTVYFRTLPEYGLDATFPFAAQYIPMMRAYLRHRACLYLGDFEGANAYGGEFNRMLEEFKAENGVTV